MDAEKLAQAFAGEVCFREEIDRQFVLPLATPGEVTRLVCGARALFHAPEGGYI